jgi:guanylate kinase
MERKSILRKFEVSTSDSCYLNYDFFINNLTSVRNTIKEKYPEVKDKDIEIEIEYEDAWDETNISLIFSSPETDEEYATRMALEKTAKENMRKHQMQQLKKFLKENPDLKEIVLNS